MTFLCPHCQQPIELLTTEEVAQRLGLDRSRIQQLARRRSIGTPMGANGWRLFTPADVAALSEKKAAGRPRA